jgi:hypothetical protein
MAKRKRIDDLWVLLLTLVCVGIILVELAQTVMEAL